MRESIEHNISIIYAEVGLLTDHDIATDITRRCRHFPRRARAADDTKSMRASCHAIIDHALRHGARTPRHYADDARH